MSVLNESTGQDTTFWIRTASSCVLVFGPQREPHDKMTILHPYFHDRPPTSHQITSDVSLPSTLKIYPPSSPMGMHLPTPVTPQLMFCLIKVTQHVVSSLLYSMDIYYIEKEFSHCSVPHLTNTTFSVQVKVEKK